MSWDSWERAAEEGPGALLKKCVPWFAGIGVLVLAISVVGFLLNPVRQGARIVEKTIDADNVLYNYEWFKQRYQDIGAIEAKVAATGIMLSTFKDGAGPRSEWKREDREEAARLGVVLLGLRHQRDDLAAEYNARSAMANRRIFRSGELPEQIRIGE